MTSLEDDLCRALAVKLVNSRQFASWLVAQTKFAVFAANARLLWEEQQKLRPHVLPDRWWRHWWCAVPELEEQRETDIFLVFDSGTGAERFALLIENKVSSPFLRGQAEGYGPKGRFMARQQKYLDFADFETMLIAPMSYRNANKAKSDLFDRYVSYEEISAFVPEFKST